MAIDLNLIDKLLADYKKPEDIIGENGLLKQLSIRRPRISFETVGGCRTLRKVDPSSADGVGQK